MRGFDIRIGWVIDERRKDIELVHLHVIRVIGPLRGYEGLLIIQVDLLDDLFARIEEWFAFAGDAIRSPFIDIGFNGRANPTPAYWIAITSASQLWRQGKTYSDPSVRRVCSQSIIVPGQAYLFRDIPALEDAL